MKWNRITVSTEFILKMIFRRRIVVTLFFVIPIVFLGVVELTTSNRELPFLLPIVQLAVLNDNLHTCTLL